MSWTGTATDRHGFAVPQGTDNFLTSDFASHVDALDNKIPKGVLTTVAATGTTDVTYTSSAYATVVSATVTIPDGGGRRLGVYVRAASVGGGGSATLNYIQRSIGSGSATNVAKWGVIGGNAPYPQGCVNFWFFETGPFGAGTYTYSWLIRSTATTPFEGSYSSSGTLIKRPGGTYDVLQQPYMTIVEL